MPAINLPQPKRGEIWWVELDPTRGAEIKKKRPAVIISSDHLGKLPLKLVVPLTQWNDSFKGNIWHVRIDPDSSNGLAKASSADAYQLRTVSRERFDQRIGVFKAEQLEDVVAAVAALIEYS